jgi:hypothetical protein
VLATRSGSELYTAELAEHLLERGHSAVIYTPAPGQLAHDLRRRSIPVVSDLRMVTEPPDVIHGQHTHETLTALLAFPGVPAIQMHHGWVDLPPSPFPRILRNVAVDDTVRDRLVSEWGVPVRSVEVIRNFVNPARLPARSPLPERPSRALVFSNSASHHLDVIRAACAGHGITVDAAGSDVGNVIDRPADVLGHYDLVFAKARCAMEAMAIGCAVILCDRPGLGPMITSRSYDELRRLNFGLRTLTAPVSRDNIATRLDVYDAADAALVSQRLRNEARIDDAVDRLLELYESVIAEWKETGASAVDEELQSASRYLQGITADPSNRAAAGALLKSAYFRLAGRRFARWLMPSPQTALRIYRRVKGGS